MNKNSKRLAAAIIMLAAFITATCTLRTLACLEHLENNLIYFSDYRFITAANILLITGLVALTAVAVTTKKEPLRASFSSPLTFIPTGIVAAALSVFFIVMLALYTDISTPLPDTKADMAKSLALITAMLAPLSVVHFFFSTFLAERHAKLRAYFAVATVLLGAFYAAFLYFNPDSPINAPNKLVEQMAYLSASLFFLYETRISLGREMWRGYTVFGLIASLLTAYASVPAIITYAATEKYVTETVESAVLLFAFFIFIFARMCMTALASPDRECAEMAALREYAERREEELHAERVEDGEQISITELIDIPKALSESSDEESAEDSDKAEAQTTDTGVDDE